MLSHINIYMSNLVHDEPSDVLNEEMGGGMGKGEQGKWMEFYFQKLIVNNINSCRFSYNKPTFN